MAINLNDELSQIAESICVEKLNLMFLFDYIKDKSIKRKLDVIIEELIRVETQIDEINQNGEKD